MTYKTLSTIVHDIDLDGPTLQAAADFAFRTEAHLSAICLGIDHTNPGAFYAGAGAIAMQESLNIAIEDAKAVEAAATGILERSGAAFEVHTMSAQVAALARTVAEQAALSDLAILPAPYGEGRMAADVVIMEGALFSARLPVLVLPAGGVSSLVFERPLIAWNESLEALAAIRAALPLLRAAGGADIVIVDPPRHGPERSDPGGALAAMLHRHGISANVAVLSKSAAGVAEVIGQYALEHGNDVVVMGAYGHSRLREAVMGGATRDMLEYSAVPVFMAH